MACLPEVKLIYALAKCQKMNFVGVYIWKHIPSTSSDTLGACVLCTLGSDKSFPQWILVLWDRWRTSTTYFLALLKIMLIFGDAEQHKTRCILREQEEIYVLPTPCFIEHFRSCPQLLCINQTHSKILALVDKSFPCTTKASRISPRFPLSCALHATWNCLCLPHKL